VPYLWGAEAKRGLLSQVIVLSGKDGAHERREWAWPNHGTRGLRGGNGDRAEWDRKKKKLRDVTRSVTEPCLEFFHALQAKHPILPCPRRPIYIIIFPSPSCLTPPASPLPPQFTVSIIRVFLSQFFLTLLQTPISVTSVLIRRAQIFLTYASSLPSSSSSSSSLIFSSVQPTLPLCAIRLFAFASPSISFPSLSAPNLRPELNPQKRKKNTFNTFYSPWPLAFNPLLPLLIHAPPPMRSSRVHRHFWTWLIP
jgi:hypothetical protein